MSRVRDHKPTSSYRSSDDGAGDKLSSKQKRKRHLAGVLRRDVQLRVTAERLTRRVKTKGEVARAGVALHDDLFEHHRGEAALADAQKRSHQHFAAAGAAFSTGKLRGKTGTHGSVDVGLGFVAFAGGTVGLVSTGKKIRGMRKARKRLEAESPSKARETRWSYRRDMGLAVVAGAGHGAGAFSGAALVGSKIAKWSGGTRAAAHLGKAAGIAGVAGTLVAGGLSTIAAGRAARRCHKSRRRERALRGLLDLRADLMAELGKLKTLGGSKTSQEQQDVVVRKLLSAWHDSRGVWDGANVADALKSAGFELSDKHLEGVADLLAGAGWLERRLGDEFGHQIHATSELLQARAEVCRKNKRSAFRGFLKAALGAVLAFTVATVLIVAMVASVGGAMVVLGVTAGALALGLGSEFGFWVWNKKEAASETRALEIQQFFNLKQAVEDVEALQEACDHYQAQVTGLFDNLVSFGGVDDSDRRHAIRDALEEGDLEAAFDEVLEHAVGDDRDDLKAMRAWLEQATASAEGDDDDGGGGEDLPKGLTKRLAIHPNHLKSLAREVGFVRAMEHEAGAARVEVDRAQFDLMTQLYRAAGPAPGLATMSDEALELLSEQLHLEAVVLVALDDPEDFDEVLEALNDAREERGLTADDAELLDAMERLQALQPLGLKSVLARSVRSFLEDSPESTEEDPARLNRLEASELAEILMLDLQKAAPLSTRADEAWSTEDYSSELEDVSLFTDEEMFASESDEALLFDDGD